MSREWRYRVAAAYRWAFANGRPMPPGLDEHSQTVRDLVAEYETNSVYATQDRERDALRLRITDGGRHPDETPTREAIAYVELCSRQAQANLMRFLELNSQAARPRMQREPNQGLSLEELAKHLGVRATEQGGFK